MKEGAVLPGNISEPHSLRSQLVQRHALFLPRRLVLVVVLQQQGGQKDPRLQHHVLLLSPHQPEGRVIHKALDLLAGSAGDVSDNKESQLVHFKQTVSFVLNKSAQSAVVECN